MRITSIGHAGLHIETKFGTILCDPWMNPAYFESWFPFPDNTWLDWDSYGDVDYLYVSHLHRDHFDPQLVSQHVSKSATVLLPDFPVEDLRFELEQLGFTRFLPTKSGQVFEQGGLRMMVQALKSPADGPLGDSLLAVDDGTARVLNQNDARPTDLDPIADFGPFDVHFLQFSGAIWWPWTYELPESAQRSFGVAKRANGLDRAARYVRAVGARHVVPSAGPACFLDDELFSLNDLTNDSANTFPDQTVFVDYLHEYGLPGGPILVPGATIDIEGGRHRVIWPGDEAEAMRPFTHKARYLRDYADRMRPKIEAGKRNWDAPDVDVLGELKDWFEPLLKLADGIRAGIGGPVLLRITGEQPIVIDFPAGEVRQYDEETCRYEFTVDGRLIRRLIADHQVDWVNSLFLSLRFRARRVGLYNEFLYTFFKCLAPDRMMYAEGWFARERDDEVDIQLDDWIVQRRCPHMQGDLSKFGETDGTTLTCTVHGWRFDLATGRCLVSDAPEHRLRSRPADAADPADAAANAADLTSA